MNLTTFPKLIRFYIIFTVILIINVGSNVQEILTVLFEPIVYLFFIIITLWTLMTYKLHIDKNKIKAYRFLRKSIEVPFSDIKKIELESERYGFFLNWDTMYIYFRKNL